MPLRRLHFVPGRLLGAADLAAEQDYHRERLRRLARATLGAGIVSGLEVRCGRQEVTVSPGMAIDCLGELIELTPSLSVPMPLPAVDAAPRWVVLQGIERPGDPLPIVPPLGEETAPLVPAWFEESAALAIVPIDPMRGHRRARHRYACCGQAHALPLARLAVRTGRWRLDPAWRPSRLSAPFVSFP